MDNINSITKRIDTARKVTIIKKKIFDKADYTIKTDRPNTNGYFTINTNLVNLVIKADTIIFDDNEYSCDIVVADNEFEKTWVLTNIKKITSKFVSVEKKLKELKELKENVDYLKAHFIKSDVVTIKHNINDSDCDARYIIRTATSTDEINYDNKMTLKINKKSIILNGVKYNCNIKKIEAVNSDIINWVLTDIKEVEDKTVSNKTIEVVEVVTANKTPALDLIKNNKLLSPTIKLEIENQLIKIDKLKQELSARVLSNELLEKDTYKLSVKLDEELNYLDRLRGWM